MAKIEVGMLVRVIDAAPAMKNGLATLGKC